MELNTDIFEVLKQFKIDKSQGTLCLLGIYYGLDIATTCNEFTVKAINLTGIVTKDYEKDTIKWEIPLFKDQQTEWEWVKEWNAKWNPIMSRKASNVDCIKRMQEFFKKYPVYRKEDVMAATTNYMATSTPQYYKNSAAFIFDGAGVMKKSILLSWCEKLKAGGNVSNMRGKIIT